MCFLHPRGDIAGRAQFKVAGLEHTRHLAAVLAGEGDDAGLALMRGFDGADHVGGVARGGNRQQQVARPHQGLHLLGKDLLVAVVVGDRGERRGVGGQGDAGQARALALVAAGQFGGEVLGVGGGAAVAAGQHLVAGLQHRGHVLRRAEDRRQHAGQGALLGFDAGLEMRPDTCLQIC